MIIIDENTLLELGIDLGEATSELLKEIDTQLNERIGAALLELLDDEKAKEFLQVSESGDSATTTQWLEQSLPEYKDVIQDEVDILLGEIASSEEAAAETTDLSS